MDTTQLSGPMAIVGDQRPPGNLVRPRLTPPRSALIRTRREATSASVVHGLGWFSMGLGLAELVAPRAVGRATGMDYPALFTRACGARELACAAGLLSGRHPQFWLWMRFAGDLMDLAAAGAAVARRRGRMRAIAAAATVGAVTAIDWYAARRLQDHGASIESARPRAIQIEQTIAILRTAQDCYAVWRDFEGLPRFMRHLESVRAVGPGVTHWVAKNVGGARIEWDSEVTNDQPGRLLAWRAVDGSEVEHAGAVRFEPEGDGTVVSIEMQYAPPAGTLGAAFAKLFGDDPAQTVREDLRRFKRWMETGEIPTTEGQPSGRRGMLYRLLRKGQIR